jgi:hypothetical protein
MGVLPNPFTSINILPLVLSGEVINLVLLKLQYPVVGSTAVQKLRVALAVS